MRLRPTFSGFVLILLLLAAALLAAFLTRRVPDAYNPLVQLDLSAKPNFMTPVKLRMLSGNTGACMAVLRRANAYLESMPDRIEERGCALRGTVTLSRLFRANLKPEEMRCDIEFEKEISADEVREILREAPGCMVVDKREDGGYVTPVECVGEFATFVSRIREDATIANGINLWVVSDNLRKGAALNTVQIAESLINRGLLKKAA